MSDTEKDTTGATETPQDEPKPSDPEATKEAPKDETPAETSPDPAPTEPAAEPALADSETPKEDPKDETPAEPAPAAEPAAADTPKDEATKDAAPASEPAAEPKPAAKQDGDTPAADGEPKPKPDDGVAVAPAAETKDEVKSKPAEKAKPAKKPAKAAPEPEKLPEIKEGDLKIGFLQKYAAGLFSKGWKRQFVVLTKDGTVLNSYNFARDYNKKPAASFSIENCDGVTTYDEDKTPKKPAASDGAPANGFVLRIVGKPTYFSAETEDEAKAWLQILDENRQKHYKEKPAPQRRASKKDKADVNKPAEAPTPEEGATPNPPKAEAKAEEPAKEETKPEEPAKEAPAAEAPKEADKPEPEPEPAPADSTPAAEDGDVKKD